MKGKIKKTVTCEWIKIEPVEGERCNADSDDVFLHSSNLIGIFEYRANLLLQRTGWELSSKLTENNTHPIDAWNSTQVFFLNDLAKAYGELVTVTEFAKLVTRAETENGDTKECIALLFRLHCLHRIQ